MDEFVDYYRVLEVHDNASLQDIKKSFRRLSLLKHPDKNKSPNAHEEFVLIVNAYEVLKDSKKRTIFDSNLEEKRKFDNSNYRNVNVKPPVYNYTSDNAERYANMRYEDFEKVLNSIINFGRKANNTVKKVNRTVDKILYWIGAIVLFPVGLLLFFKSIVDGNVGFIILGIFLILIGYGLYSKARE